MTAQFAKWEVAVSSPDHDQNYVDSLRMSEKDQQGILESLNGRATGYQSNENRGEDRLTYSARGVLVQMRHPGGSVATYMVRPRNLSRGGIAFLHGSFCYTGTACTLTLRTLENETSRVRGKVVRCTHVDGNVHEVAVQFEESIEVYQFVQQVRVGAAACESRELPKLRGNVLFADKCIDDRELFTFLGQSLGLTVESVEDADSALQVSQFKKFELIVVDQSAASIGEETLLGKLKESGWSGQAVAVTTDDNDDEIQKMRNDGFAEVLTKPFDMDDVLQVLGRFLARDRTMDSNIKPVYSEQWDNRKMRPLILNYLDRLQGKLDQMQSLLVHQELEAITGLVREIKGASGGYGYPQISAAADELLNAASGGDGSTDSFSKQFEKLAELCAAACRARHEPSAQA